MSLKITSIDETPLLEVKYLNAGKDGEIEPGRLPVIAGRIDGLPPGLEAIVASADLQFVWRRDRHSEPILMGVALPEILSQESKRGVLPPPESCGVILAGDLFALEDLSDRGGLGDVRPVWNAFLESGFRWVAGVAGNHDAFGPDEGAFGRTPPCLLLDGEVGALDGLRIGGVGGILQRGQRARPCEKDAELFKRQVEDVLLAGCDLLILHQGPDIPHEERRGHVEVREVIEEAVEALCAEGVPRPLLICGHRHWDEPLSTLPSGMQVLNVDKRVVVLRAAR